MVSFYHQLHCLRDLQVRLVGLSANTSHDVSRTEELLHESQRFHVEHCFSYIRQGIRCAADTTLEGPDLIPEPGRSPLRGWGVQHQCRKWDDLLNWMEENAAI